MNLLEQDTDLIFKLNNDLNNFICTDKQLNQLFQEFRDKNPSENGIYEFIYDEVLEDGKKIIDLYIEEHPKLIAEEKAALNEFKNTIKSVFRVESITREGFELYNLVNEKFYRLRPLIKMLNYRGVLRGNYLVCRIVPFNGTYFLFSINCVLKSSESISAYRLAVSRQIADPGLLYKGNQDKFNEISRNVEFLAEKFEKFFDNQEIITLNTKINQLLDAFNDYVDDENQKTDFTEFIKLPQSYGYFDINKLQKPYDVGVLFDPEAGLVTVPFYATFCKIFEFENYGSVENYKSCVEDFVKSDKVSPFIIKKVYERFGSRLLIKVGQILGIEQKISIDDLLTKYKQNPKDGKNFSSPTVLYSSRAFEQLMQLSEKQEQKTSLHSGKIGRNSPCFCGSGIKYKKCCIHKCN